MQLSQNRLLQTPTGPQDDASDLTPGRNNTTEKSCCFSTDNKHGILIQRFSFRAKNKTNKKFKTKKVCSLMKKVLQVSAPPCTTLVPFTLLQFTVGEYLYSFADDPPSNLSTFCVGGTWSFCKTHLILASLCSYQPLALEQDIFSDYYLHYFQ